MLPTALISEAITLWGLTVVALSDSNVGSLIQAVGLVLSTVISGIAVVAAAQLTRGVREDRRSHKRAAAEVQARNGGDGDDG